jgi:hypothetical protein
VSPSGQVLATLHQVAHAAIVSISLRIAARRIAVIRHAQQGDGNRRQSGHQRGEVIGHVTREDALRGKPIPDALREQLSSSEYMQVRIAIDRWRAEYEQQQIQEQLAHAAHDLERLTALFQHNDSMIGSDLMAAVEHYRLRAVITAWEALGVALRQRAEKYGAEHLIPLINIKPFTHDDDPVIIASDQSDTQTMSEKDADKLRGE